MEKVSTFLWKNRESFHFFVKKWEKVHIFVKNGESFHFLSKNVHFSVEIYLKRWKIYEYVVDSH